MSAASLPASIFPAARYETDRTAFREEIMLALAFFALVGVTVMLALVGASSIARPLYMVSALGFAFVTHRRSPWLYLSATLWFWLITAFVRRLINWHSGYVAADIVLATPDLALLFVIPDMLTARGLFRRPAIGYALLLAGCGFCGLFVSFFKGDVLPGLFAATDWIIPLLYLFHFIGNADRIEEAEAHFSPLLTLSTCIIVPYTIFQYFFMPDWDGQWMVFSGMGAVGDPLPEGSHVFGTLNNPGILAIWLGMIFILLAHFRSVLLLILSPLTVFALALTQVRTIYATTILAVAVGLLIGRGRFPQLVIVLVFSGFIGAVGGLAMFPDTFGKLEKRIMTVQNLKADDSAQVRAMIWTSAPGLIADHPFGLGIGAQGRGGAGGTGKLTTVNIDFGPLSVYLGLGWIPGTLYIFGMFMILGRALWVGRSCNSSLAATMSAAAICSVGTFLSVNVIGFSAVVAWICIGYALAIDIQRRSTLSLSYEQNFAQRVM